MIELTPYEEQARSEADHWRKIDMVYYDDILDIMPDVAPEIVGQVMPYMVAIATGVMDQTRKALADAGGPLSDDEDVSLENKDRLVDALGEQYMQMAQMKGVAMNAAGLPGLTVDIPDLVGTAMTAIAAYAACYGFDVRKPAEKTVAMLMLAYVSLGRSHKPANMKALTKAMKVIDDGDESPFGESEFKKSTVRVCADIAERLAKFKYAQCVAHADKNALMSSAFNYHYLEKACITAKQMYRRRLLAAKSSHQPTTHINNKECL